jgi:hypothetical protein
MYQVIMLAIDQLIIILSKMNLIQNHCVITSFQRLISNIYETYI